MERAKDILREIRTNLEQSSQNKLDYSKWEADFGFLSLILERKKNITKKFLLETYSNQKSKTDYVTDEEIEPIIVSIVEDVLSQIGGNYKEFLIKKYFGTEDALIAYISEDVYVDMISSSVKLNTEKIGTILQDKLIKSVSKMNRNEIK